MTLFELFQTIKEKIEPVAFEESGQQARHIICHVLNMDMARFLLNYNRQVDREDIRNIGEIVNRRLSGEPLQYIFGTCGFYGLEFIVDSTVLIPRQDTETLVENALRYIEEREYTSVLDLCCGSGCIGITISILGDIHATLSDVSTECIELSRQNARKLNARNTSFVTSDLFENISNKFDLITINPPYLSQNDMHIRQLETKYEPDKALFGGNDGLDFYRRIAAEYKNFLNPKGALLLEIGASQGEAVSGLFTDAKIICDMNGLDRVVAVE